MNEQERADFIARFKPSGSGIGFAVLGGVFAEGIDLPGDRLIGAFIATLGLPQVNAVNEAIADSLQQSFGMGHEYTYLYPGLQKVAQAAGRASERRIEDLAMPASPFISRIPATIMMNAVMFQVRS